MKQLHATCCLLLFVWLPLASRATIYYSQGNLDVCQHSSWNSLRNGGGSSPAVFTAGDVFVVQNGHQMITGNTWSISGSGARLWIETGGVLTSYDSIILSAATTFQIDNGATYIHDNAVSFGSSIFKGVEAFALNSTVELRNSNGTGPSGVSFGNLIINLQHNTANVNLNGAVSTIAGDLSILSTNGLEFRLSTNTPYTLTIAGNMLLSGGTVNGSSGTIAGREFNLSIGGDFIQSGGTFTHTNTSSGSPLNVTFTGANSNFTRTGGTLTGTNINWTVANGASLLLNSDFSIAASRSFSMNSGSSMYIAAGVSFTVAGTADFNHQHVTLRSTVDGTASIPNITGSLLNADNVTTERFVGGPTPKRAWRLIAPMVTGTTINAAWQEGVTAGNPNPGYGTQLTGGTASNGFDGGGAASIKTYDGANWVTNQLTATNSGDIAAHQAYMIFIRGDRSVNLALGAAAPATNTILRSTGSLRQGNLVNYQSVAASGYTLLGNPYPAAIDFEAVHNDYPGLTAFYTWDPYQSGSYGYGAYNFVERTGAGTYEVTPYTGSAAVANDAHYIPTGAAVLVQGTGSAFTLSMAESYKTSAASSLNYFKTTSVDQNLAVNLETADGLILDGMRLRYDSAYSNQIDQADAVKLNNAAENIAVRRGHQRFIVERRKTPAQTDTVQLHLSGLHPKQYLLKCFPANLSGMQLALLDMSAGVTIPLCTDSVTIYSFNAAANPGSDTNRFRLLIQPAALLPVRFTRVEAVRKGIQQLIRWCVADLYSASGFSVQHSPDGVNFSECGVVQAIPGQLCYEFNVPVRFNREQYYRITMIPSGGSSEVLRISSEEAPQLAVLQPVAGTIQLRFTGQPGRYWLRIFNCMGAVTAARTFDHGGGTGSYSIGHTAFKAGMYLLHLCGSDLQITRQILIY